YKYARLHDLEYGLVMLDPPSFARSKKHTFSTAKDYPALLSDAIAITKDQGVSVASTNNASFDMKKFKQFIKQGFDNSNKTYQILEEMSLPKDFTTNKTYQQSN